MVDREITDGRRIAEILEAEIVGLRHPPFDDLAVTNKDADADPTGPGGRIFDIEHGDERLVSVVLQPDRLYLEFDDALEAAKHEAKDRGLRVRPKATTPPGLLVFVENGAQVKRAVDVIAAAATAR